MPSSAGPVSWLINGYHRHADPQAMLRFVCSACQAPIGPSRRQRLLASFATLAASALVGWWLYSSGLLDGLFAPWGR